MDRVRRSRRGESKDLVSYDTVRKSLEESEHKDGVCRFIHVYTILCRLVQVYTAVYATLRLILILLRAFVRYTTRD